MATSERAAPDQLVARPPLRELVEDLHERRERARLGGGEEKIARQHAADKLTARARIQEAAGSLFAGSGHLFREEVVMSGVIPQVAALLGPCAAGTAYIPGLADFVPMVKGRGSMALAGPLTIGTKSARPGM